MRKMGLERFSWPLSFVRFSFSFLSLPVQLTSLGSGSFQPSEDYFASFHFPHVGCLFFFGWAVQCSMWDLSSLTRDQVPHPLLRRSPILATAPLGKSLE